MNFSKMSGYEFEDFIANLLRQKGFKVTQTDYSNDGGVDLIAEYNQPLFSGKYIVQCKKYTDNLVGQPELRDLYGVVMSESANKGILITTSDFTTQAKNFAKGKNLELINGKILNSMIEGENITVNEPELKFYEMPDFDKKNYEFLKKRLKAGKKNPQNYDNLTTLLESYILNANVEVCKAGLFDEIRNLREEKRINTNKDYVYNPNSNVIDLNKLDLCFIEGDLLLATKTLIESKDFYFSNYPSFLSFYCCLNNIYYKNDIFFNMDFYKKDPLVKRIKTPNFLASYNKNVLEEIYKHLYIEIPEYFLDEGLDNWVNNISKIVDKNFSNIYSQEELKAIVEKYKHNEFSRNLYKYHGVQVSASISDWKESDFNGYLNDLHKAKYIFMNKLRVDWKLSIKTPNLFRHLFLDKFNPFTILANSNTSKFTKLGNLISPLFGYPFKLMLYSAFKQIGFETGCVEMTKHIKIPKSINDFPFIELPEISKLLSPIFVKEYYKYVELEINSYKEFLNGALNNIFNPVWHEKYYKKSDKELISEIIYYFGK